MQNNIIRHHRLGGKAAPKNAVQMDKRALGPKELARAVKDDFATVMQRPMNVASTILNFSRKHGGSLANKLKLKEMGKAALPLLYDASKQPKLYANLAADVATDAALAGGAAVDRATERAADVKEKVGDKIRGGLYDGNEKINQATAAAADKAGKVIDRTKEGASQVGQAAAAAGLAGVGEEGSPVAPTEGTRRRLGQQPSTPAEAPEGETEAEAAKRLRPPADTIHPETGERMTRQQRNAAGRAAAKEARRQPEPEPVVEDKPGIAERAAMGAAGAVDVATEKVKGIGSAMQARKDSMASETDKVEVEQDAERFGSDAPTGGKRMDRPAKRRQAKDVTKKTGVPSKDVQITHPEPDTPVGKLQGFVGSVHGGREHRVDTDTSVAPRPDITPAPEATDTPAQQGLSRAERRKQKFGSKPGASGASSGPPSGGSTTAVPPQRPSDISFRT